jgi:primase-polymerase (primpol)-like protein
MIPAALSALSAYKQFLPYYALPDPARPGKTNKFPCDASQGYKVDAQNHKNWLTYDASKTAAFSLQSSFDAVQEANADTGPRKEFGVAFVITKADPFFCLDIDGCLVDGEWTAIATEMCTRLSGAAVEVSRSGTGLHIWGSGELPAHGCRFKELDLELYSSGRFIALGMDESVGDAGADMSEQIGHIVAQYFPPSAGKEASEDGKFVLTGAPCAAWRGPADDSVLIKRMLASKSTEKPGRCTVQQLWNADVAAMSLAYPDPSGYGLSEVDAALATHLAWWTGAHGERVAKLMAMSALARGKYDREDYMRITVFNACETVTGCYVERPLDTAAATVQNKHEVEEVLGTHTQGRIVNGNVFAQPEDQLKMWAGFTYIADANKILTDTGMLMSPDAFKGKFGGWQYVMDLDNGKLSQNAFEAFTQSRACRQAKSDHTAFRPDLDPSNIFTQDGESFANTYRKLDIARVVGDPSPLLNHLKLLLPNKRDRAIMLAYMAAVVQYQGVKFQWAPLIQGVEGNGKSMLSRCVAKAVGWKYTHEAKASEIAEKYNSWLVGMVLITVEDVYTVEGKLEVFETLKPMITNGRLPIRAMNVASTTLDICANFMLNTNHKDALRKTENDRRICNLYTAQQCLGDLVRDGMDDAYFKGLYGWLDNEGGYAIVSEYLHTYEIPAEFGLNCLLSRAPDTTSTAEAIMSGLGRVEQEVMESIVQGGPGFAGGWVSSNALDTMLRNARMELSVPRNKRRDMMLTLGYEWHPGLNNGRVTTALPDGTKPTLYIKKGHAMASLTTIAEVSKAFLAAQKPGVIAVAAPVPKVA